MTPETLGPTSRRRSLGVVVLTGLVVLTTMVLLVWWVLLRAEATPWGEVEVGDDGTSLVVHYVGGECDSSADLEVEESAEEVVLTVKVSGRALTCSDVGVPRRLRATLEEPLGGRTLVDGACRQAKYAQHLACSTG